MKEADSSSPRRFYRNKDRGMLFGVCAGIADYFDWRLCAIRWILVIATLIWPILLVVYLAIGLLAPARPREMTTVPPEEEQFWKSMRRSPTDTFSDVRHAFRRLEQRTQKLERYVTSPRFKLEQEFNELERQ